MPRCWETLVSLTSSVTARRIIRRKKQALVDQSKILSMHYSIRKQYLLSLPVFLSLVPDKMFHFFSASHLSPCLNTQIQFLPPSNSPCVLISGLCDSGWGDRRHDGLRRWDDDQEPDADPDLDQELRGSGSWEDGNNSISWVISTRQLPSQKLMKHFK